jgi:tellurite resistance protein TerC
VVVVVLLVGDWFMPGHRHETRHVQAFAWLGTGLFVLAAAAFAAWIFVMQGRQPALEFVAGYTIETSLSIDNLFVFLVLFQGFHIGPRRQHKALIWGVAGAVVLRGLFIITGVSLLNRFEWINWIFGLFLLYAAFRLVRGGSARSAIPGWIQRLQPAKGSLLPVILAVEVTDLLFAVDSIPAVLGVSHNPFVVYTSNIAAVLGLRSLYFSLAAMLDRFRYLHYGLGALLAFVALKMLAGHWIEVPITLSLAVMGAILVVCALTSWIAAERDRRAGIKPQVPPDHQD